MKHLTPSSNDEPRNTARQVLQIEADAIAGLVGRLDATFDRAVGLIVNCKGRVIVTGMGKSGIICQKLAASFSSTGCPAHFMHPVEAVHGDLGMIVAGDVLLAISNSGETAEIVRLLEVVRRLGARIIALSGNPDSPLARLSDVHLDVSVDREACSWDLVPTASTTASLAMGDALVVASYQQRGFSERDFARYHPGGRLGRKLLQVQTLMHQGTELPLVRSGATMADALQEMTQKRLGMTCVVDAEGVLLGLLTDGDVRRRLLQTDAPMQGPVDDAMTRSPETIAAEALASAALKRMEERRITSLPVVDSANKLRGVIQIHDLWRTELF